PRGWRGFLQVFRQWLDREAALPDPTQVLTAEQTDGDTSQALYAPLARENATDYTPIFIEAIDMAAQTFTYLRGERLQQRGWTVDAAGVLTLAPDVQEVQRATAYLPVGDPAPVAPIEPYFMSTTPPTEEEPMP